jgi:hypothetical protein
LGQVKHGSTWQVVEQPSPGVVLPSSQVSPGDSTQLPHKESGPALNVVVVG